MDSVTRLAMAQREIGLAAGEPPSQKGYTPSVFNLLPKVLERAGNFQRGSITGFFTVLVEGDDFNEPICDAVRAILDGHIILSRAAGRGGALSRHRHPALRQPAHFAPSPRRRQKDAAAQLRQALAVYRDSEDLIQLGAYVAGSNPVLDASIRLRPEMLEFLRQDHAHELRSAGNPCASGPTGRAPGSQPPGVPAGPRPGRAMTAFRFPSGKGARLAPHAARDRGGPVQAQSAALAEIDRRRAELRGRRHQGRSRRCATGTR